MARIEKVNTELIPMALELRREMLGIIYERDEGSFEGEFSDLTEDFFKSGDQTTVLAFDAQTPIGCATICYITLMPTVDHPYGKRAHIMNVYVRKKYRRRGIAREMLSFILEEAKRRGISYVSLDATESGRPLYKSLGFGENHENMGVTL
ncbi:MAG: GNAT family N-acetyltransferase [Oscillospiraceae bacterium]|nr:GNAT family N-acetyltransferase [Oscillospiraceae bacterium]